MEILIGFISGIVSGIGMGGGTILILVLSLFMGVEQHVAQACNIVYFIPTSIVAIIVSSKEKLVNFKVRNTFNFSRNGRRWNWGKYYKFCGF